jgi:hypothetical protein
VRARVGLVAATAAICAVWAVLPGAAVAGTLDQQQTATVYDGGVGATGTIAQVFKAGITGKLDRVDLLIDHLASPTDPLNLEIRNTSSAAPGSTVLATVSLPPASVPTVSTFVPVTFASPPAVVAGTQYAIVLYSADPSNNYGWGITGTDVYAGGDSFNFTGSPPGPSPVWNDGSTADTAFKTYVVPPAASATGLRAKALAKCKKKHSKKARKKCRKKAKRLPV